MRLILYLIFAFLFSNLSSTAREEKIITSDSVELYVHVKGSGIPCLYIHGGPGSGSYWLELFFGDYLEQHFQMIYLDQRGVGRSSSPVNSDYSMARMLQDFEEVRQALGIQQWLTLGHSFGGIMQTAYALAYPASMLGMIMVNCTLDLRESFCNSWIPKASALLGQGNPDACAQEPAQIMEQMGNLIAQLREREMIWQMGFAERHSEELMNETYTQFRVWNADFGAVAFTIEDYWKDYRPITRDIAVPVLFCYGSRDWMVGPQHYRGIAFPNQMIWEGHVGHMPFLESKSDLEAAIARFLRSHQF